MSTVNRRVALEPRRLNDIDEAILAILSEGRATPALVRTLIEEQQGDVPSRSYIGQRMVRLAEHGHLANVRDSGVYELVSDPREDDQ